MWGRSRMVGNALDELRVSDVPTLRGWKFGLLDPNRHFAGRAIFIWCNPRPRRWVCATLWQNLRI
jgi:hypothetical protein